MHIVNAEFIKKLRMDMKMSQAQFSQIFGVTYQSIQNWENNRSLPNSTQSAMLVQLRNKYDSYYEKNRGKNYQISDYINGILLAGGIMAFLFWLFNQEEK